ncbi:MAG: hypothetical protein NVS9B9_17600 [Ktedonobacteraceae bacterium]
MSKPPKPPINLDQLDQDQLLELIAVAEDVKAQISQARRYVPNSVQDSFHRSQAFIRALLCANGVGKSTACINEAIWSAMGTHPHRKSGRLPNKTIIVLDDPHKADSVYLQQLKEDNWYDYSKIRPDKAGRPYTTKVTFPNGSEWVFMGHEVEEDKWESIEANGVIFDEPPPRFIFAALLRGQRKKGTKPWIAFAGTPRGKHAPWMYKEIWLPWKTKTDTDIQCFTGTTFDNIHNLEPGTIERWQKYYTAEELEVRLYGKFEFLAGAIFKEFQWDYHVCHKFDWPYSWPCILAIDPHLRKNHVGVILGRNPDGEVFVVRELETNLCGREAAKFFLSACRGYKIVGAICDNFGSMAGTGGDGRKSFIDIFNRTATDGNWPFRIRPTSRAEKRDDEWIEDMHDYLRVECLEAGKPETMRAMFHVFDTCTKLISNFETYMWDEHRDDSLGVKEKPLGTNCDFLMCVKYGLAMRPDKIGEARVFHRTIRTGFRERTRELHE